MVLRVDLKRSLDVALQVHPDLEHVFVVSGVSDVDRVYRDSSREQFRPFAGRLEFHTRMGWRCRRCSSRWLELPPAHDRLLPLVLRRRPRQQVRRTPCGGASGCRRERADVRVGRYTYGSWQCRRQRAEHRNRGECVGERRLAGTARRQVSRGYPRARDRRQCDAVRLAATTTVEAFARAGSPRAASSDFGSPHSGISSQRYSRRRNEPARAAVCLDRGLARAACQATSSRTRASRSRGPSDYRPGG